MLKRILLGFAVLLILFLGAVLILPGLVPTDTYREKLEAELSRSLARDVDITGEIKVSTFPSIAVQTDGLSLSNPEGFTSETFMKVDGMSAKIKLLPLISKQVEISGIEFDSPAISLEKRADGEVNWQLGGATKAEPKNTGPFKRDGRYTDYDPSLKLLRIKNGTIAYKDAVTGKNHTLSEVNLDLRAPGLSKPLKLDGDLIFNDLKTSLSSEVQSPANFLTGKATDFEAKIETIEANVDVNGQFSASQEIAFTATFSADSNAPLTIAKRLPLPDDITLPPLTNLSARGEVNFDGKAMLPKLDAKAEGEGFNVSYLGQLDLRDGVSAAGKATAKLTDLSVVTPYLKEPIEALSAINAVDVSGDINLAQKNVSVSNLIANVKGDDLATTYSGEVKYVEDLSANGIFEATIGDLPTLLKDIGVDQPEAAALKRVNAKGNLALIGNKVSLTDFTASTSEGPAQGQFQGRINYDESLDLGGAFDATVDDLPALLTLIGQSQADAVALKRISASGNIEMLDGKAMVTNLNANASEGFANGQFNGNITYDDALSLNGTIGADIPDLAALNAVMERELPYSNVAKHISISTDVETVSETYAFKNLSAKLEDGRLNGSFDGDLAIGDTPNLNGNLVISADSLRAIAISQNIDLPPNTDLGPIFENLSLSGRVSGKADSIEFKSGSIQLDKLSGTGDFTLLLSETKPNLTGSLDLGVMDLRPYMSAWSAQRPTGQIMPWSTSAINLTGLNSANAQIDITTPSIQTDRIELGQTDALLTLESGTLTAKLNQTQLYEGTAKGALSVSTTAAGQSAISIETNIRDVDAQNFLAATGGFDKVSGQANFYFDIQGTGSSQADIMRNLNGDGTFNILNGQLTSLDAEAMITGFEQAVSSRKLPSGIGLGNSTDFEDLNGAFTVTNGVATIAGFDLTSGNLQMEGDGQIDLGNQTLDIGFRPKLQGRNTVVGAGVPLRFSGKFGQAKPGLDTEALKELATARARDLAAKEIQDRIGGSLGSVLGGFVGGNTQPAEMENGTGTNTDTIDEETSNAPEVETIKDDAVGFIVNGLLGGNDSAVPQPSETETETEKAEISESNKTEDTSSETVQKKTNEEKAEDEIKNALKGLFGKKN